jgi:malonyl-CoA/methylmalonyl-CoA synthetase
VTTSPLVERFHAVTRAGGARVAIVDDRESVSFELLAARARAVAGELRARGLSGRRVALLVTQGSRWVEALFGIVLADAVAVPLSHLHPEAEQAWFVGASGAAAIVVSEELTPRVAGYAGERPVLPIEVLREGRAESGAVETRADDVALILYTSGTTGKPKGALISHGNLEALARLLGSAWHWSESDTLLHCLPLHHLHGLGIALLTSLLAGGATRMLEKFDAGQLWEQMDHATVLMGVPTMHKRLIEALDAADDPTRARWAQNARALRLVTSGSAALPITLGDRWRVLTGRYPLERFGMTEIGVGATNPVDGERVPGSCGPALDGMQIRIVAEDGHDVAPGESGEIWIKGPSVFLGYDGNEQATREAFTDGWFRSGDTATFLDDGYLKILGRTSVDILKSGGYKLSALEIEEVLREHPAVADVAVVGLPDDTWGEIAVAAVIARPGRRHELEGERLRDFAKERIASYKVPKRVVLLDEFPRNPVGKVMKPELAKRLPRSG